MSRCRSCDAEIIWALTVNGKRIPLDAEPAERPTGLFQLDTASGLYAPTTPRCTLTAT